MIYLTVNTYEPNMATPQLFTSNIPSRPSRLKIIPTRNTVNVQYFSRKKQPRTLRLSSVLGFTSDNATPPQVTNSSLKVVLPRTSSWKLVKCSTNRFIFLAGKSAHRMVSGMLASSTNCFQSRWGNQKALGLSQTWPANPNRAENQ